MKYNKRLQCQLSVLTRFKFLKFPTLVNYCLFGKQELPNIVLSKKRHSKLPDFHLALVISFLFLLCTLFSASTAQGLTDLPSVPPDMKSTNYSEEDCNFGSEAWSTVKKHHDTKLRNLERKIRQLCLLHPNSVDSKIALAKEYIGLGKELLNVTQYDKAILAFQNARVLLKDIPSEQDLYKDTIKEIKGCHEKKKQRATFLGSLKLRQKSPSKP